MSYEIYMYSYTNFVVVECYLYLYYFFIFSPCSFDLCSEPVVYAGTPEAGPQAQGDGRLNHLLLNRDRYNTGSTKIIAP